MARGLLFVPALALLGFTLWQRSAEPPASLRLGEPDQPLRTGEVGSIDGWEGRVPRDGAAPLKLRLERLHPEAGRQRFDADALGGVLRKEAPGIESEPWRLTLSVAARPGAWPPSVVVDRLDGVLLAGFEPIVRADEAASGEPVGGARSALQTLMRFPSAPLAEGEACALVFWGSEPEGAVRAEVPGVGTVELLPQARTANQSSGSIARLDGRSPVSEPR